MFKCEVTLHCNKCVCMYTRGRGDFCTINMLFFIIKHNYGCKGGGDRHAMNDNITHINVMDDQGLPLTGKFH